MFGVLGKAFQHSTLENNNRTLLSVTFIIKIVSTQRSLSNYLGDKRRLWSVWVRLLFVFHFSHMEAHVSPAHLSLSFYSTYVSCKVMLENVVFKNVRAHIWKLKISAIHLGSWQVLSDSSSIK